MSKPRQATVVDTDAVLPHFRFLTPTERRYAVRDYKLALARFDNVSPDAHEENRRKAINVAYYTCGQLWLGLACFSVPACAFLFAYRTDLAWGLCALAAICCIVGIIRARQSRASYPKRIRLERGWRQQAHAASPW
jgi:hypothetical protein